MTPIHMSEATYLLYKLHTNGGDTYCMCRDTTYFSARPIVFYQACDIVDSWTGVKSMAYRPCTYLLEYPPDSVCVSCMTGPSKTQSRFIGLWADQCTNHK